MTNNMGFSEGWDNAFSKNTHLSVWPWSDLVSFFMRYARPDGIRVQRVLELGCGAGANIPFFRNLGASVNYYGIEGSKNIVERLQKSYPDLRNNLQQADFTKDIPFQGPFDVVIDRGSLTHNTTESIRNCLKLVRERMVPGGKYIGIDWFTPEHSDYFQGAQAEDLNTRTGYTSGTFANIGRVHFTDRAHLEDLFEGFQLSVLQKKIVTSYMPDTNWQFAGWNFVAELKS